MKYAFLFVQLKNSLYSVLIFLEMLLLERELPPLYEVSL